MIEMGTKWVYNKDKKETKTIYEVVRFWLEDSPPGHGLPSIPYNVLVLKDMKTSKTHGVAENIVQQDYTQVI